MGYWPSYRPRMIEYRICEWEREKGKMDRCVRYLVKSEIPTVLQPIMITQMPRLGLARKRVSSNTL